MTSRRQSKRESVIKKSLKVQEKLKERAKKKGVANPESGPLVDEAPVVEDNLNLNVNIDPNPADTDSSEQSSDEEVYLETIEEVEQELVDPKEAKMDETEYNTQFRNVKAAELAVKDNIEIFNSETVSDLNFNTYLSSLKYIGKELKFFVESITNILIDLKDNDLRKDDLKASKAELFKEVKENEKEVKSKMKKIKESVPDAKEEAKAKRNKKTEE